MEVTQTVSGLTVIGDWDEVAETARETADAIDEDTEEFDRWRPREHEDMEDVREKTVEEASVDTDAQHKSIRVMKEATRSLEEVIYSVFIARFSPQYFDSEEISAVLERNGDEYELRIIPDEKGKEEEVLERIED